MRSHRFKETVQKKGGNEVELGLISCEDDINLESFKSFNNRNNNCTLL